MRSIATRRRRGVRAATFALCLALLLSIAGSGTANAEFGIDTFSARAVNADGSLNTQAGAPAYASQFAFGLRTVPSSFDPTQFVPDGGVLRDVVVDLPKGFVGNPQAVPFCTPAQLAKVQCSPASQIGVFALRSTTTYGPFPIETVPLFNIRPAEGYVADFGFFNLGVTFHLRSRLLSDGYTIRTEVNQTSQAIRILSAKVTLWGDPANPVHDVQRGSNYKCPFDSDDPICLDPNLIGLTNGGFTAGIPRKPLTNNPSDCSVQPVAKISVRSWEDQDTWSTATDTQPAPTGCDALSFDPTIDAVFDTTRPDSPTGLSFRLNVPQSDSVTAPGTPPLKTAKVTLPEGVSMNPSSAEGLTGCTDAQVGLGTSNAVGCPDSSKLGDVTIVTPLLDEPVSGPIYLGQPVAGKQYRIFLVAENARYGLSIRLEGQLLPDPNTGRITAVFENNPEVPFSSLDLRFTGGPRAPLATGLLCGAGSTTSELTPWGGAAASPSSSITISADGKGAPCPAPGFAPTLKSGATSSVAGGDTSFTLTVGRQDGQRYINDIGVALPKGLLGRLASVPLCAEGPAAAGACDAVSQIGTTTVGAGTGPLPFYLGGKVFLTGPYKGAPFGMSIVVPAKAGPFDLGTVVVRAAIHVDRNTAALTVLSDPLPQILEGIPLRIRAVNVTIDRSRFMINPTSCAPGTIAATVGSLGGAAAQVVSRFQVGDCGRLPFRPKMTLQVGARGKLTRGKRTPLNVTLSMTPGQANNKSVQVTLPKVVNARLDVVNRRRACSIEQFRADRCPMVVGTASAVTPLLRDPLRGPAYFVYNPDRRLPDLVVRLKGQVDVDLVGKVTITRDLKLQTTFDTVPDVPITKFTLRLESGSTNGPVGLTKNVCLASTRAELKAALAFKAHSGRRVDSSQKISVAGCAKPSKAKKK